MLAWFFLGAAGVFMMRVADAEGRDGVLWAVLTVLMGLGCEFLLPGHYWIIAPALGCFLSFMTLFAAKVIQE